MIESCEIEIRVRYPEVDRDGSIIPIPDAVLGKK